MPSDAERPIWGRGKRDLLEESSPNRASIAVETAEVGKSLK
jgi:hypothetical protein